MRRWVKYSFEVVKLHWRSLAFACDRLSFLQWVGKSFFYPVRVVPLVYFGRWSTEGIMCAFPKLEPPGNAKQPAAATSQTPGTL